MSSTACTLLLFFVATSRGDIEFIRNFGNVVGTLQSGEQVPFDTPRTVLHEYDVEEAYENPRVDTTSGFVIGSTLEKAHAFFSVPYAAPPLAALR